MPVKLSGSTSGFVTLQATAVAGSNTITMPAETGTAVTTASTNALPVTAIQATGTPSASTALLGSGAWGALTGNLIRAPQVLTSGTSYTTPSNCTTIYVEMVGGGGGGGGSPATANYCANSGSAGAYTTKYFTVTPSTSYVYAIGAAGTGGAAGSNNGTAGGNTTFTVGATTVTATGGALGVAGASTGAKTTNGVTATNGDWNPTSNFGWSMYYLSMGGSSPFGQGGFISTATTGSANVPGSGYGSGGAGGVVSQLSPTAIAGSNGAPGLIRIWEYT